MDDDASGGIDNMIAGAGLQIRAFVPLILFSLLLPFFLEEGGLAHKKFLSGRAEAPIMASRERAMAVPTPLRGCQHLHIDSPLYLGWCDDPVGYISLRKYVGQTEDSSLCGIPTTVQLDRAYNLPNASITNDLV